MSEERKDDSGQDLVFINFAYELSTRDKIEGHPLCQDYGPEGYCIKEVQVQADGSFLVSVVGTINVRSAFWPALVDSQDFLQTIRIL